MRLNDDEILSPADTEQSFPEVAKRPGVDRRFFLKSMGVAAAAAVLADKAIIAGVAKIEEKKATLPPSITTLGERLSWKAFVYAPENKSLPGNDGDTAYQGCLMGLRRDGKMFYQEFRWGTSSNAAIFGVPVKYCQRPDESSNQALHRAVAAAAETIMKQFSRIDSAYEAVRTKEFIAACAERPFANGPLYQVKSGIFRPRFEFIQNPVRRDGSPSSAARV